MGEKTMKTVSCRSRITVGQALAVVAAILAMLVFAQPSLAGGDEHRTLRLLLDKGIITQQEYDQTIEEEKQKEEQQQEKIREELRKKPVPATTLCSVKPSMPMVPVPNGVRGDMLVV